MKLRQGWRWALALVAALGASPAPAQLPGQPRHVAIELVAETDVPAAGDEVTLAFVAKPDPGWHGYWQNPGDAGVATTLDWTLPAGVRAGPLRYPVPQRLLISGLMNYVYAAEFTQFVTLRITAALAAGTALPIGVSVKYLVCTERICVPEQQTLATTLRVGDGAVTAARRAQFDGWRRALPRPLGATAKFAVAEGRFRLAIPFPADAASDDAYFYPLAFGTIDHAAPQTVTRAGDTLVVETKAGTGRPSEVAGVLAVGDRRGFAIRAVPGTVPATGAPRGIATTALLAFLGAMLGGLILNIMPCVFPIISLKALGLARSGQSEAHARAEALAYSAGVVLVCVALGAILLGLRAGGASVGWAFQLQDPHVIVLLLLLVTGIAFNLAGLFELPTPAIAGRFAGEGRGGAFATGALAAFVATPCTGPFMGAALGAALVLPTAAALAIFAGLGLGMALPFLLIGFVPALRRRMPRPGPWMATFRHVLAVPMFLTAIALTWVLGQMIGVGGVTSALVVVLAAGVVLWAAGRRQARGGGFGTVATLALVLIAGAGVWLAATAPRVAAARLAGGAEPFSAARLAALRAEGRPVFAYFTADWCVTCKVNERTAIATDRVAAAFAAAGVAVLVGDWTDGDPALGRFIEAQGRAGVPLYLWYPPGAAEPRVLPQVLTPGLLTGLVKPGRS